MRIFVNNLDQMMPRRGLYRVWVRVVENGRTRLVARWINPDANAATGDAGEEAPALADVEARRRGRPRLALAA